MALSDKHPAFACWGWDGIDRHYCCAKKALWPGLVFCLPVAPRLVYPACRFLNGRRRKALPRFPTFYECVSSDPLITR